MKKLKICGGRPLWGEVEIGGCKNAALPILFATVLLRDCSRIENLPRILDVERTLDILRSMGARIIWEDTHTALIDTRDLQDVTPEGALVSAFRASSYLLGAGLGRFGHARITLPGGCRIGARPLNLHTMALSALGAEITELQDGIYAEATVLSGAEIHFAQPSVGATVNAILAAVSAEGDSRITGAAREPHIEDFCRFLNKAGAEILGAGESELRIRGGKKLRGVSHRVMPDPTEAGTFLSAVGITGGEVTLKNIVRNDLLPITEPLSSIGLDLTYFPDGLRASRCRALSPFSLVAAPHPGFPTDMHPQMTALASFVTGDSEIRDTVFCDRFGYVGELRRMGAELAVASGCVRVSGGRPLSGADVTALDLRAGAALTVAALGVDGVSEIQNAEMLERGYEDFATKLKKIGASVDFV